MSVDLDDEILQDFLVEAGEILELLSEQLVELEQSPEDLDLLNAIFRGFHTIKGGAGFLALDPLVNVCHKAEDVFNILRQGDRKVSADLMDVILEVVDVVNVMFEQVKSGQFPEESDPNLLQRLQRFTQADDGSATEAENAPAATPPASHDESPSDTLANLTGDSEIIDAPAVSDLVEQEFEAMLGDMADDVLDVDAASDEITEEEFDQLLDELHGAGKFSGEQKNESQPKTVSKSGAVDPGDITEEEFENLLDELHGAGKFSSASLNDSEHEKKATAKPSVSKPDSPDEITEDEFDQLLDDLHGKGKFHGQVAQETGAVDTEPKSQKKSDHDQPTQAKIPASKPEKVVPEDKNETAPPAPVHQEPPAVKPNLKQSPPKTPTPAAHAETTVRVDTNVLDDIMNMVGELVLVRNRFQTLKSAVDADENMAKAVANLDVVTADLQLAVMKTRMQPIKKVFGRFPRVVRDLSRSLKKEIRLELVGEETDLDKNLVEALADPLIHLVRNAVDHGIESPDARIAAGKPREGVVVLTASQEGDHIMLSIRDDGKGMNPDMLRQKAVEKGLMDEESAARLDDKECYNLIFMPGFSTKTEISDVSGRGVGMDVVKTRIAQMNGVVEIDSEEGAGSKIIIKVPLTLAIMPTLMVILGGQAFALPLASVLEILDLDLSKTNVVDGQLVIMVRHKALPLFFLSDWLVNDPYYTVDKKSTGHVVVVNAGGRQVGFVVDQLIGQEEVVIKPLGAKLQGLEGLSGATITGDGKIALILDVPGLMNRYAS
jgi:two-component system chemotaxis sensor kinase CheA